MPPSQHDILSVSTNRFILAWLNPSSTIRGRRCVKQGKVYKNKRRCLDCMIISCNSSQNSLWFCYTQVHLSGRLGKPWHWKINSVKRLSIQIDHNLEAGMYTKMFIARYNLDIFNRSLHKISVNHFKIRILKWIQALKIHVKKNSKYII